MSERTRSTADGDLRPIPDPTTLTTEQLLREILSIRTLLEAKIDAVQAVVNGRIDATKEMRVANFEFLDEKLQRIEDWRREQKIDTQDALRAALQAAKELVHERAEASDKAITKSEIATAEQIRQQYATVAESLKGLSATVFDVKDRVVSIESLKLGATEQKTAQRDNSGMIFGVIGAVVGLFSVIGAVVTVAVVLTK